MAQYRVPSDYFPLSVRIHRGAWSHFPQNLAAHLFLCNFFIFDPKHTALQSVLTTSTNFQSLRPPKETAMAFPPLGSGPRVMRDLLARGDKDRVPTELKEALSLLKLSGLDALEERFLATDAFLRPWAIFRDSIWVMKPDAMPRRTVIATSDGDAGISRTDILWFYTQFDEDIRRHDPGADEYVEDHATKGLDRGIIDKQGWGIDDYEKHLFVWLLQTFKVGKKHNPWGFDFFQLRNVCTAWQAVFVPIINAVRASYSVMGRRHYGRLALFIEDRCPSGLAFPKENVSTLQDRLMSPTPYRVVSIPKASATSSVPPRNPPKEVGILTRKHYDETEKELRHVYPQYGGLVERPRFKHKMEEWLEEQRARANLRKAAEQTGEAEASRRQLMKMDPRRQSKGHSKDGGASPIKRYSDSVRRSLSRSKQALIEEPKSPLHGVTRELQIPGDQLPIPPHQHIRTVGDQATHASLQSSGTSVITPWPRPDTERKSSEPSVYGSVRKSNPFNLSDGLENLQTPAATNGSVSSSKNQPSATPLPQRHGKDERQDVWTSSISKQEPYGEPRIPSYRVSGCDDEITSTKLEMVRENTGRTPEPRRPAKPPTRLPGPIKPAPYTGRLRVASENSSREVPSLAFGKSGTALPQPVAWPGTSPDSASLLSAASEQNDLVPPVPTKSPRRKGSIQGYIDSSQSQQEPQNGSVRSMARIVLKENIRSALNGDSLNSSADVSLPQTMPVDQNQDVAMNPAGTKLQAYNKNLFPRRDERKGTPVGGWVGAPRGGNTTAGSH